VSAGSHAFEQAVFDAGFRKGEHCHLGTARDVYRAGKGPPVILLSEIPGITPATLALARRLLDAGYSVILPQLMGHPGRPVSIAGGLSVAGQLCVSKEFELLALRKASPITDWLRSLARAEHARHGGPGVGVIGMCLTGGFALAMMVEPSVIAPVLSQPSLPLPVSRAHACALGVSDADLATIKKRVANEDLSVLGLRFTADVLMPGARFRRLHEELGDHFVAIEIDSKPGNLYKIKRRAHSVLTEDFVDTPGHPTREALQQVLALFARKLIMTTSSVVA